MSNVDNQKIFRSEEMVVCDVPADLSLGAGRAGFADEG